ncbi:MAG: PLP-dependent aminotransferase family protein [Aliishimia sp.]
MATIEEKNQSTLGAALFALSLERSATHPLHMQLTEALRNLILTMDAIAGARLPSTRALSEELSVSRMTVSTAYEQLLSEGYLVARRGAGTFVATDLPHLAPPRRPARAPVAKTTAQTWRPFQAGLPDHNLFPHQVWARHLERAWRTPEPALLQRPDPFGWFPLRQTICAHLSAWRGLDCRPEQIVVTAGAADAFEIVFASAVQGNGGIAHEDPGWASLRHLLARSSVPHQAIRIDDQGLDAGLIPDGIGTVIVTPSRHYPTGIAMSLPRRLALLEWARKINGVIIEDDYDSEFRYQGQPLPSLSGLDSLENAIYLGSFSKLLSPALRISYIVVPERLLPQVSTHLAQTGPRASLVPQPALARFMETGEFAGHLRRMRRVYSKRQAALVSALEPLGDVIDVRADPAGMHLFCPIIAAGLSDQEISNRAGQVGLTVNAVSGQSILSDPPQGLILGYAGFEENALIEAAQTLIEVIRKV